MHRLKRKLFSQNFLRNSSLVKRLVQKSSIESKDLVVEIGSGKGIITDTLVGAAQHVIAVEIDKQLCEFLQLRFANTENITIYQKDFQVFKLPSLPYKVFSNIPFAIAGKIIRQLINDSNPPEDCYLVVRKEFAYRLSGRDGNTMFTTMHKPWFDFSVYHQFSRADFVPVPNVDAVMFRFHKRENILLSWSERFKYQQFIERAYKNGIPIRQNLCRTYGVSAVAQAMNQVQVKKNAKPGHLSLDQWIRLYKALV